MRAQPFHILDYLWNFPGEGLHIVREDLRGLLYLNAALDLVIGSDEIVRRYSPEGQPIYFVAGDERANNFAKSRSGALRKEERRCDAELKEILRPHVVNLK